MNNNKKEVYMSNKVADHHKQYKKKSQLTKSKISTPLKNEHIKCSSNNHCGSNRKPSTKGCISFSS